MLLIPAVSLWKAPLSVLGGQGAQTENRPSCLRSPGGILCNVPPTLGVCAVGSQTEGSTKKQKEGRAGIQGLPLTRPSFPSQYQHALLPHGSNMTPQAFGEGQVLRSGERG